MSRNKDNDCEVGVEATSTSDPLDKRGRPPRRSCVRFCYPVPPTQCVAGFEGLRVRSHHGLGTFCVDVAARLIAHSDNRAKPLPVTFEGFDCTLAGTPRPNLQPVLYTHPLFLSYRGSDAHPPQEAATGMLPVARRREGDARDVENALEKERETWGTWGERMATRLRETRVRLTPGVLASSPSCSPPSFPASYPPTFRPLPGRPSGKGVPTCTVPSAPHRDNTCRTRQRVLEKEFKEVEWRRASNISPVSIKCTVDKEYDDRDQRDAAGVTSVDYRGLAHCCRRVLESAFVGRPLPTPTSSPPFGVPCDPVQHDAPTPMGRGGDCDDKGADLDALATHLCRALLFAHAPHMVAVTVRLDRWAD